MKQKNKKTLKVAFLSIVIVMLIIILINNFVLYKKNLKNKINNSKQTKEKKDVVYNKNKSFKETQTIKNVTFSNIECSFDGKNSLVKYTLSNRTKKKIHIDKYEALIKDKNKVLLSRIFIDCNNRNPAGPAAGVGDAG